ncbi:ArdC family protein [Caulobacter sp. KR2-114]|uniref:ArdC family protein n=1 Tax=Caulobacter sp. KR2-114 TaxID=3400912 RepID=UPI003C0F6D81
MPYPHAHAARRDLHAEVAGKIIAALQQAQASGEAFVRPWHVNSGRACNLVTGKPYRGVNTLITWAAATEHGYTDPTWASFQQWRAHGCPVRRGEKATTIIFWQPRPGGGGGADSSSAAGPERVGSGPADAERPSRRFIARAFAIFNAAQVEGYVPPPGPRLTDAARIARAEAFFDALPLTVTHGGDRACYRPVTDTIALPPFAAFRDAIAYYAVRAHESIHATGAPHRLDRDLTGRFGSEAYAFEELIAELGAAFICADLALTPEPRPDHAHYLASWVQVLQDDPRAIFTAAGHAQTAADWLHAQQPDVGEAPSVAAASGAAGPHHRLAAFTQKAASAAALSL